MKSYILKINVIYINYCRGWQPYVTRGQIFPRKKIACGPHYLEKKLLGPHLFKKSYSNQ